MALSYAQTVQQYYIAYYGRPADTAGLTHWTDLLAIGVPVQEMINFFGSPTNPEFVAVYGANPTPEAFIEAAYNNIYNRGPDTEGAAHWLATYNNLIAGGATPESARATLVIAIVEGVAGAALWDQATFNNKMILAEETTELASGLSEEDAAALINFVRDGAFKDPEINKPSVLEQAQQDLQNEFDVLAGNDLNPGQTFTLTVGEDSGPAFTGGAGNDTFNALVIQDNNAVAKNTLENFDSLDGDAGTDTLNATLGTNALVAPTLKNIEILNIRTTEAGGSLSLLSATGVEQLWSVNSTAVASFSNIGSVAALGVKNQNTAVTFAGNKATAQTFVFDTVGKSTKAADEVVVTAAAAATSATFSLNNANVDLAGVNTIKTATISTTGANRLELSAAAGVVETVTVTGAGSVDLADVTLGALKTLSAADHTGGIKVKVDDTAVTVTTGAGKDNVEYTAAIAATAKVNLGAGDDTLKIAAATAKGATVDGGDGVNTLAVTQGGFLTADSKTTYTKFQTLEIGGGKDAYNLDNLTTITAVKLSETALAAAASITNAAAGVTLSVNAKESTDLVTGFKLSYALKDAAGKADALTVALNALDDGKSDGTVNGVITVTELEANGIETITIGSNITGIDTTKKNTDYTNTVTKLTADAVSTVVVTGNANLTVTDDATTFATVTKIDASAATGKVSVDATGATAAVQFLGGVADDTFTASAAGSTVNAGKGADTVNLAGGKDTVILNAGDSILTTKGDGHDKILTFTSGSDSIDLGSFGFTGQQSSAIATKGVIAAADVLKLAEAVQTDFFVVAGVARGVATATDGGDTFVFVDTNKDGSFDAATDLVVQITGAVTLADIGF